MGYRVEEPVPVKQKFNLRNGDEKSVQTLFAMSADVVGDAVTLIVTLDRFTNAIVMTRFLTACVLTVFNVETRENIANQGKLPPVDHHFLYATSEHFL